MYNNAITIIIMKRRKPIPTNTSIILQSHTNAGNNDIIPAPIKPTPTNPPNVLFLELNKIKYPMGIAIMAIISPVTTSLPLGKPMLGVSYSLPLGS